jgi:O-antigen/teichoic acid export membrane protein
MIRNVAATAGIRLALTGLALVTTILTARYLGQQGRGDYFFMVTLATTIVQLTALGLPLANSYFAAHDHATRAALTTNSAWVAVCVAGGAGAALALGAHYAGMLQDTPVSYLWLAAALAPPALFYMLGSNILIGLERVRAYNAAEIASRVLVFAALVLAGAAGVGAGGFVAATVVAWGVSAVGVVLLLARGTRLPLRFDADMLRRGLRYAAKAYVVTMLGFLVLRSNIFLLRREWGPGELGLYSIAAQVADVLFILPQTVSLLLLPRLVRLAGTRWDTTVRAALAVAVATGVTAAVTALVARPVIGLLFGEEFTPSANVLYVMLPGVVFLATASVLGQYLGAMGMPVAYLGVWALSLLVLVASSVLLIPQHAGAGAAASLTGACAVNLCATAGLAYWYHHRHGDDPLGMALPDADAHRPVAE